MRIPGRRGGGGGAAFASEAAGGSAHRHTYEYTRLICIPIPFESFESRGGVALLAELAVLEDLSSTIVEVDDDRLNVFARGARCVSFSFLVNFHDMFATTERFRRGYMQVSKVAGPKVVVETRCGGGAHADEEGGNRAGRVKQRSLGKQKGDEQEGREELGRRGVAMLARMFKSKVTRLDEGHRTWG